jgi:hypothetical protein
MGAPDSTMRPLRMPTSYGQSEISALRQARVA